MPTQAEWIQALVQDRFIEVHSTDTLINAVRSKQQARIRYFQRRRQTPPPMKPTLTKVAQFDPPLRVTVNPFSILHAIGVTTTPPIPNLSDLSSTWALLRYIWAFNIASPGAIKPLCLSQIAEEIDFHQKGLLSDEIGVGMSAYLMSAFMGTPRSIDVKLALNSSQWNITQQFPTSPDYIFYDDVRTTLHVVECKGNQTSRNVALDQLRRGTEQVPSIIFNSSRSQLSSFIIATYLKTSGTDVFVIDPPPADEDNGEHQENGKAKRIDAKTWHIKNEEDFYADIELFNQAKLLVFAGDEEAATRKVGDKIKGKRFVPTRQAKVRVDTDYGTFQGARHVIPTPDGTKITLFRGLKEEIYSAYTADDRDAAAEQQLKFQKKIVEKKRGMNQSGYTTFQASNKIYNISTAGTLMEIGLS